MLAVARRSLLAALVVAGLAPSAGCGGGSAGTNPDAGPPPSDGEAVKSLTRLQSAADFQRLAGEQWAVKYLARVDGRRPPVALGTDGCLFQNTALYPLHLQFLRTFAGLENLDFATYLSLTQRNATRTAWAGELRLLQGAVHPRTGRRGVVVYFVYADTASGETLTPAQLAEVHGRLAACAPFAGELLVLAASEPKQAEAFAAIAPALRALGVDVADYEQLVPRVAAEGYSVGEGYGYLRVVPAGQAASADDFGPRDLVVMQGALEDLGLVAGLVTSLPQNVHSHVNLRLREKKIPNARIADVFDDGVLAQLDGKLARLQVTETTARIDPATLLDAEAFWAMRHPPLPPLKADLTETRVQGFPALGAAQADAYGRKAANLGELYGVLPPANRAAGFGIPFSTYRDWMHAAGLDVQVTALLTDPRTKTDAAFRRTRLAALRAAIEAATVPAALIDGLAAAAREAFGEAYATTPLRFRSSSNVEDGEQISGAGLYDSARACLGDDQDSDTKGPSACVSAAERADLEQRLAARRLEQAAHPERVWLAEIIDDLEGDLGKERSAARALKKVYASLWNDRAFEERAYWGLDHAASFMGVAVNAAFVMEGLDAVGVTNLDSGAGGVLCRVVSQSGGNAVVRPDDPTLVAETMTFRLDEQGAPSEVQVLVPSSLSPTPLWSVAHLAELGQLLAVVQDHFARVVYPTTTPLSLDLEIKLTSDDRVVIKQARPYILEAP
jgi:hypothetical protein